MSTEGTIGVIGGFLRVNEMPSSEMLATKAAIEIAVKIKENMKIQQLGQKAALAILKTGIMLANLDLLVKIVIQAAKNPKMNASPTINVTAD